MHDIYLLVQSNKSIFISLGAKLLMKILSIYFSADNGLQVLIENATWNFIVTIWRDLGTAKIRPLKMMSLILYFQWQFPFHVLQVMLQSFFNVLYVSWIDTNLILEVLFLIGEFTFDFIILITILL